MKQLVTAFHAFPINKLARLPLMPFSKFEWVWPTHRGAEPITVPITVLQDALHLPFPLGTD